MKNKSILIPFLFLFLFLDLRAQNTTFSPYSRYGIGELSQKTLAHNAGMGGAFVALRSDSTMPIFLNTGNPASYALIRLTSLEVGGRYLYSDFRNAGVSASRRWGTYFSYGALGFPMGKRAGASLGIMPYSAVGYETQSVVAESGIGDVTYRFNGSGGLNKAFLGYGIMPFQRSLVKYRTRLYRTPDSLRTESRAGIKAGDTWHQLLSDLSLGANAVYVFGSTQNITRVVYPDNLLYNSNYRERTMIMGDFTGNFGLQTALTFDSVSARGAGKKRIEQQMASLKSSGKFTETELQRLRDSLSERYRNKRRALSEKVKLTFGFFSTLQNPLNIKYSVASYNYILNASGQEIVRDTALYSIDQKSSLTLPLEQGFGIGFKKGERLNAVADFAITDWKSFRYLGAKTDLITDYRVSVGINFVPEKYAAGQGAFWRKANYRIGASYQTGYIKIANALISDYFVSLGVGFPVGISRLSSMVHVSAQLGQMASSDPALLRQNYLRVNFGFTFCDKWFQKFRYD